MTSTTDLLRETRDELIAEMKDGRWVPGPGDALHDCDFIKTGFRSWGLEAPDKSWRMSLSKLDFGAREPSALLTVYAPNHVAAFPDLDWLVFTNSIGTNGGTNHNQCVKRLTVLLGATDVAWERRITYLIGRARQSNAGANNGTFSISGRPAITAPPPYVFEGRVRQGRTISLFGPGSAGKTTLVDGMIAGLCAGHEVIPGWKPTRKFSTLILDWDEGQEEEMVRLAAICAAHQIDLDATYHYKRQTRPLHDVADEIGAYIVANGIEVVVVSPMGRAQRNFGENITAPVDEVHEVLRAFGTTNILIDHVTGDNMKGGADREFGSVRKRDNVRGSYAVDVQSEEPGTRVLRLRNTKADALAPRQPAQAIRVEYEPPWPHEDGTYDTISFHPDQVVETVGDSVTERQEPTRLKDLIYDALESDKLTQEELAKLVAYSVPTVKRVLYRYSGRLFNRLPSSRWERLPGYRSDDLGDSQ